MNSKRIRHEIARELKGGEKYEFKVLEKVAIRLNLSKSEVGDCIDRMVYKYGEIDRAHKYVEELTLTDKYDPCRNEPTESHMIAFSTHGQGGCGNLRVYVRAESENTARIKLAKALAWLAENLDDVEAAVSAGNMEI